MGTWLGETQFLCIVFGSNYGKYQDYLSYAGEKCKVHSKLRFILSSGIVNGIPLPLHRCWLTKVVYHPFGFITTSMKIVVPSNFHG